MLDLVTIKRVNLADLCSFLKLDHIPLIFRLNISLALNSLTGSLAKNNAKSFYLKQPKLVLAEKITTVERNLKDDCLTDAQNCDYFKFFNRKEKRLYVRFLDKIEANFEGTEAKQAALFLTLTFNTTQDNLYAFTTNADPNHEC